MDDIKLLDNLDDSDITSILELYIETKNQKKHLIEIEDALKNKIRVFLKTRKWEKFKDDKTNISVSLSKQSIEKINKTELKNILSDAQYATVVHITSFERLNIITPETRERLKKYVNKKHN